MKKTLIWRTIALAVLLAVAFAWSGPVAGPGQAGGKPTGADPKTQADELRAEVKRL